MTRERFAAHLIVVNIVANLPRNDIPLLEFSSLCRPRAFAAINGPLLPVIGVSVFAKNFHVPAMQREPKTPEPFILGACGNIGRHSEAG